MSTTTVEDLKLTILGREVVVPFKHEYVNGALLTQIWEHDGMSVMHRVRHAGVAIPKWEVSTQAGGYSDSDPAGQGNTLEEAVGKLEEMILSMIHTLLWMDNPPCAEDAFLLSLIRRDPIALDAVRDVLKA